MEKIYALYCDGNFIVAKPMFNEPKIPADFGVGAMTTSNYMIATIEDFEIVINVKIPATIVC
jgi:hypothetical protein